MAEIQVFSTLLVLLNTSNSAGLGIGMSLTSDEYLSLSLCKGSITIFVALENDIAVMTVQFPHISKGLLQGKILCWPFLQRKSVSCCKVALTIKSH